jgi:hypothetical protein
MSSRGHDRQIQTTSRINRPSPYGRRAGDEGLATFDAHHLRPLPNPLAKGERVKARMDAHATFSLLRTLEVFSQRKK